MLQKRWTPDHSLSFGAFRKVNASFANRVIRGETGSIVTNSLKKQWRFFGHLARSSDSLLRELLQFRNFTYVRDGTGVRARDREWTYRRGGQQMPYLDKHISLYAEHKNWHNWIEVASDRSEWQKNERSFIDFASTLISKE
eukprot:10238813-Karenia_brevis.AAC.1